MCHKHENDSCAISTVNAKDTLQNKKILNLQNTLIIDTIFVLLQNVCMQIELINLKKTYISQETQINAVDNISLEIPENKIFGIIGKSGAGKSSLVRLISLLEKPDSGEIYYDNNRVDNLQKNDLILQRRRIGMIFQNFNLLSSRNAEKNIAYPLEICGTPKSQIKTRVQEMLKLVGLEGRGSSPISTLSGGQKQRIAIARALSTNPDILFCDEATSALDPQTTHSILDLIREIQQKMNLTVVMITHQMEVVRDACDLVAVIDSGKLVEQGSVSEIFSKPKSSVTKEFLSHIQNSDEQKDEQKVEQKSAQNQNQNPEQNSAENPKSEDEMLLWSNKTGKYILRFVGESTGKPVLSSMLKKFNVEVNLLGGGIQHLKDKNIGTMKVDFSGEQKEIEKALFYLQENNVIAEKI